MLILSHKQLEVYQLSISMVNETYRITKMFPRDEVFVLISQIRRAAISVISNIAEGASRISRVEKKRFYEISRSSLVEMDTQFELALNLHYITKDTLNNLNPLISSIFNILCKMIKNLDSASR